MNLPELPEPGLTSYSRDSVMRRYDHQSYTADQLRSYAEEAVKQEREACAKRLTEDEIVRLALKENVSSDYAAFRAGVRSAERVLIPPPN